MEQKDVIGSKGDKRNFTEQAVSGPSYVSTTTGLEHIRHGRTLVRCVYEASM
jgi:hypothetical protein